MKTRIFWVPLVVLIAVAIGFHFYRRGALPLVKPPAHAHTFKRGGPMEPPPPAVPLVSAKAPVIATNPIPLPPIKLPPPPRLAPEMILPIQDQATIDFSIGSPVIKRGGSDSESMERALKEMEEATKNLYIPPTKQR